jgi:CheY-like chemotaxis protein
VVFDLALLNVLVVDDSLANRKLLSMLLTRKGIKTEQADNGLTAVEMVRADLSLFSIVLMDNLMPVMSGLEATRALREAGFGGLILGVTGNVTPEDLDEYILCGANFVLTKPVYGATVEKLLAFVSRHGPKVSSESASLVLDEHGELAWRGR